MSVSTRSYLSDDSSDNFKTKSVLKTSSKSQHRSSEVSGWLCIPKSVVMATSLELKLAKRLENGQALNISSKWNSKKKQLHEKTVVYAEAQKYRPVPLETSKDLIEKGCLQEFLDESLAEVGSLSEKFGKTLPERYKPVKSNPFKKFNCIETDARFIKDTQKSFESSLSGSRQAFVVRSPEVQNVLMALNRRNQNCVPPCCDVNNFTRPFTADFSLKSQSLKAQEKAQYRPSSSCSSTSFKAMKNFNSQNVISSTVDKRLPGYPRRVIRNRSRRPSPVCNKRPIMTTQTSWYPLSFSNKKGKLIELDCDSYGYQTFAYYTDLCHSLSDGMAVIEQEFEIGDEIVMRILDTDRRLGLLSLGIKSFDSKENLQDFLERNSTIPENDLPNNYISSKFCIDENEDNWKFSCEISNLKPRDQLHISRDTMGRILCKVNGKREQLLFYFKDSSPACLSVCLGLGVTRVQLLGCSKGCENLLSSEENLPNSCFPIKCSFCEVFQTPDVGQFKYPYACSHILLCPSCSNDLICRLCQAPKCWLTCPLCDTRRQPY